MDPTKFLGIGLGIILVANLFFMIFGLISPLWFFIVAGLIGLVAYKGIPYMKKKK
jgi:cobalamin biosynthesis protein CobD/CbiB